MVSAVLGLQTKNNGSGSTRALHQVLAFTVTVLCLSTGAIAARGSWSITPTSLEYYAQLGLNLPELGVLIAPIKTTTAASTFGRTQLFAFNVTKDADPASKLLGSMRGYTVQASSTADFHGVEVEVLAYDDGSLAGTISLQGLINAGTNEVAVVGGTGDFRGARGYAIVTFINSTATTALYHHHIYFL